MHFRLPACSRHRRLQAQATHDSLDVRVDAVGRVHECRHHHAGAAVDIAAVEAPQAQSAAGKTLQEKRAQLGFVRAAAGEGYDITDLELGGRERLAIDEVHDRTQQQIDEYDESRRHRRVEQVAASGQHADGGGAPERGGGVEPAYVQPFAEDQSGAEETDARHHLGSDPGRAGVSRNDRRENDERRRAQRDQRIGAQARQAVAPLTFKADDSTET